MVESFVSGLGRGAQGHSRRIAFIHPLGQRLIAVHVNRFAGPHFGFVAGEDPESHADDAFVHAYERAVFVVHNHIEDCSAHGDDGGLRRHPVRIRSALVLDVDLYPAKENI
jgi:hypothetical protein